ncbi:hypothetical protein IWW48_004058 [Coemansia sp. RSA 1200]|nr:hypothetical protein IWW48_004058 [Coemansia sp. RSA 1200]
MGQQLWRDNGRSGCFVMNKSNKHTQSACLPTLASALLHAYFSVSACYVAGSADPPHYPTLILSPANHSLLLMLSNGISSRLRQLQRSRADADDPPLSPPLPPSSSHAPEFPARKGLAADLINKFNQMSASPAPAVVVRAPSNGSLAFRSQPLPLPLKRTGASTRASANSCGRLLDATNASDTTNYSSESLPLPLPLPLPQRPSPFLTDDELHHALSEILQFSRDMNISLFDDDSSNARQA